MSNSNFVENQMPITQLNRSNYKSNLGKFKNEKITKIFIMKIDLALLNII